MKIIKCLFIASLLNLGLVTIATATEKSAPFFMTAESTNFCEYPDHREGAELAAQDNATFFAYAHCIGENKTVLRVSEFLILVAQCHAVARAEFICQ